MACFLIHEILNQPFPSRIRTLCAFALGCITGAGVNAQESIRPSAIGGAASDTSQEPMSTGPGRFMRLGPVNVNASAQMGIDFSDNVGVSEVDRKSDMIFRPGLTVGADWQVSRLNTIRLGMSIGYAKYLRNPKLDTHALLLDPGSQLSFDVFAGEQVRLNFHDRIQITQNPVDETTLSNVLRFQRLQNSSGVTAFVKFPTTDFALGYDHFIYNSLSPGFSYLDHTEEQFFASARRRVSDALGAGLEGSLGFVNYAGNLKNGATSWTAGAFADATVSEYTKLRLSGGYQSMRFDAGGTNGDRNSFGSWYANLSMAQRLSQYWSHSLTVGREARLGLSVNYADYFFARYAASWRMNALMTWNLSAFAEDARESGGSALFAEHAFRWGGGASVACRVAVRTDLTLGYQFVNKDSDLALRSYYQNSVMLGLTYQF